MRHILFIFIFISFGCQTFGKGGGWLGGQKQARKGWKRIDRDWLSAQAADGKKAKTGDRAPAQTVQKGQFFCEIVRDRGFYRGRSLYNLWPKLSQDFLNEYCDPQRSWAQFPLAQFFGEGSVNICCIKK